MNAITDTSERWVRCRRRGCSRSPEVTLREGGGGSKKSDGSDDDGCDVELHCLKRLVGVEIERGAKGEKRGRGKGKNSGGGEMSSCPGAAGSYTCAARPRLRYVPRCRAGGSCQGECFCNGTLDAMTESKESIRN